VDEDQEQEQEQDQKRACPQGFNLASPDLISKMRQHGRRP
jgi:hypothetical protein